MPAEELQVAVDPLWVKLLLRKWKDGLSFDTRLAPGLWPVHGAGTNLKVGGGTRPAQSAGNFCCCRAPPLFWPKSTISRLGECFRDGK